MAHDARIRLGRAGEQAAVEHLERLGFEILERNYRTRTGELDVVAFDGEVLVFCEVKCRRRGEGAALESLRGSKPMRVRAMAASWLTDVAGRPYAPELRFDVIAVEIDAAGRLVELDHLEAAF